MLIAYNIFFSRLFKIVIREFFFPIFFQLDFKYSPNDHILIIMIDTYPIEKISKIRMSYYWYH